MYRLIYTLLLTALMPVILLRLLWRSRANPDYRKRVFERFAIVPKSTGLVKVWVHAVSVGETIAARPLIDSLIEHYGEKAVLVSTTTPTGSNTVHRLFADKVLHYYFPYDLPFTVNRYLERINPEAFVCIETEIWPNFWRACQQKDIPVIMANARLSNRSTMRYKKIQGFISSVLNDATLIACRNEADAANFISLGTQPNKVKVLGDVKSDIRISDVDLEKGQEFKRQWGINRPVLVAASTHEGEDGLILDAYQNLKSEVDDLLLVIAPRHPERFDDVSKLIKSRGFKAQQRSQSKVFSADVEVVLGDSMGEMMAWYTAADIVFMGGSLVARGGHNPLEPLACSVPVISGPHVFNFKETFDRLVREEAAFVIQNIEELTKVSKSLLDDEELREQTGAKGLAIIKENSGATEQLVKEITQCVDN